MKHVCVFLVESIRCFDFNLASIVNFYKLILPEKLNK